MLQSITLDVWQCTDCQWAWFKKAGKVPKRCPNVKCRKRFPGLFEQTVSEMDTLAQRMKKNSGKFHDPKTCHINKCFMCEAMK